MKSQKEKSMEPSADPYVPSEARPQLLARPLGAFGEGAPFAGVKITRNVVYRRVGPNELRLDVYRREWEDPHPCVVYIHGGAWRHGDKSRYTWYCEWLASEGFVVIPISYRLSEAAEYPAQIEDCQAAVRWIREQAGELGVDGSRLAAIGGSAGAHLAALLALKRAQGTEMQAVIGYYGPYDLNDDGGAQKPPRLLIGGSPEERAEMWKDAKCTTHVRAGAPPMLLIHGDRDRSVPLSQSQKLLAKLKEHNNEAELIVVHGADHGLRELEMKPSIFEIDAAVLKFLRRHLG